MSSSAETEERIDVGSAALWVASSGTGPDLLLCSGGPGCCDYLEPVASMIDDLCRVWRFDARGCGRSDPSPPYDLETSIADLDVIRAEAGAERWFVGGHSFGANLALAYALEHPERVRGIVYVAGGGCQNDREWSRVYHEERDRRGEREPEYAFPPNYDVNRDVNASWRAYICEPRFWRRISELAVPVLVVNATHDIRPGWAAEQLAALLPAATFREVDAEHSIWLEPAGARALGRCLREFLEPLLR